MSGQGHNGRFPLHFVVSSVLSQILMSDAYQFTAGRPWRSYNAEQQASIVETWFIDGQSTSSALYSYITDHLRKGDA